MKRMLIAGSITALTLIGTAGTATAAADLSGSDCFGGVHKAVNDGLVPGVDNVGQLVQSLEGRGQGKKDLAGGLCAAG
jgi:hypothetical protein